MESSSTTCDLKEMYLAFERVQKVWLSVSSPHEIINNECVVALKDMWLENSPVNPIRFALFINKCKELWVDVNLPKYSYKQPLLIKTSQNDKQNNNKNIKLPPIYHISNTNISNIPKPPLIPKPNNMINRKRRFRF